MKYGFCQILENIVEVEKCNILEGEKQNMLFDNNINMIDVLSLSDIFNVRCEVGLNDLMFMVFFMLEYLRVVCEEDRVVDFEVVWVFGVFEKFIVYFIS